MRYVGVLMLVAAASMPVTASAHSLTTEISGGGTQATPTTPATDFITTRISAAFYLGRGDAKPWTLRPGFQYTHDFSAPAPPGANFSTSAADIYFLSLELAREIGPRFELGLEVNGSPPSTTVTDTPVPFSAKIGRQTYDLTADGALQSQTANVGGMLWGAYNSRPSERLEIEAELSFAATEYFLANQLTSLWEAKQGQPVDVATVRQTCATKACPPSLVGQLDGQSAQLFQGRLAASLTAVIRRNTDVTLAGSYSLYDRDPTTVGYDAATTRGRTSTSESSFGSGLPIAPYLFTLKAVATHRIKSLSLGLSFQFADYVSDGGFSYGLSVGLRAQYRFNRRFTAWLKASGQRDIDSTNTTSYGGIVALGGRVSF